MNARNAKRFVLAGALAMVGMGAGSVGLWAEETVKTSTDTTVRSTAAADRPADSMSRDVILKGRLVNLEAYLTGASSDYQINAMPREEGVSTKSTTTTDAAGSKTSTANATRTSVGGAGLAAGPLAIVSSEGVTILNRAPIIGKASVGTSNTTTTETGKTSTETSTSVDRSVAPSAAARINEEVEVHGKLYQRDGIRFLVVTSSDAALTR